MGMLKAETVVAYCGGGITATATAFGLALIGRPDPLVYDASLREWAPDATLPMAVGPNEVTTRSCIHPWWSFDPTFFSAVRAAAALTIRL